jgi:hypothetical protein
MPVDHQGAGTTSLAATRQGHPLLDHMPTQLGIDQTAIHFLSRRQQGFISNPFPGSTFLEPLGFEDPHPAILVVCQSIALSAIEYRYYL